MSPFFIFRSTVRDPIRKPHRSHPRDPQGPPGARPRSFGVQLFSPHVEGAAGGPAGCRPRTLGDVVGRCFLGQWVQLNSVTLW